MSIRTNRLAAVLQKDLGHILQQDYQPSGTFLTVTRVDMSPDLMNATVFISIYTPKHDKEKIFSQLEQKIPAIRQTLASKIRNQVRRIPELHFVADESAEHAEKMDHLFSRIHEEEVKGHNEQG